MAAKMSARGQAVVDVAVALAAMIFTIAMLDEGGLGSSEPGFHTLDEAGLALAILSTAPLVAVRRFPGLVWGVTATASLALVAGGYGLDVPPGPLIATYTLAEAVGGGATPRRQLVAGLSVVAYVPVSMVIMAGDGKSLTGMSSGLFAWVAMFSLVWLAGDRSRLRRERIAELEVTARLRETDVARQRRLAAAEERTRIARELHDSAGHAINVILVQAGAARLLHERDPEQSRRAIATIEDVAHATIEDIDRLVKALRNGSEADQPAPAGTDALEELVDRHRLSGLAVSATFDGAPRGLPSGVAWAAYRILQEALTNAARHGSGSAEVRMAYGSAAVDIEVSNPVGDGGRPGSGLGIVGMRERAALLDGRLDADTDAEDGVFRLRARLPYAAAGALA
ncbi:sensor histidine kinase [Actinoplanes utahensis]|nr:histidine kinase [Actinoplanes utahensis]